MTTVVGCLSRSVRREADTLGGNLSSTQRVKYPVTQQEPLERNGPEGGVSGDPTLCTGDHLKIKFPC